MSAQAEKTEEGVLEVKVVFFQEEGRWVAQGLDFDLTASGASIREAQQEFSWLFIATIVVNLENGRAPFEGVPQAPVEFWALYEETESGFESRREIRVPSDLKIPQPHIIPRFAKERLSAA